VISWAAPGGDRGHTRLVAACLPALSNELYAAVYEKRRSAQGDVTITPVMAASWLSYDVFSARLTALRAKSRHSLVGVGNGISVLKRYLPEIPWQRGEVFPDPVSVGELGLRRYLKNPRKYSFEKVAPLYLQPSWAERQAKRRP